MRVRPFTGGRITPGRIGGAYTPPVAGASGPAFRSASSTTTITNTSGNGFTLSIPTGTAAGDVLIVQMFVEMDSKSGVRGTTPAGWTQRATGDENSYPHWPYRVFSRVATGSDSFIWTGGANWHNATATMISVSGGTAVDVVGNVGGTATAPSITTTTAPTLLVGLFATIEAATAGPAVMTSRITAARPSISQAVSTESLAASGATGTRVSPTFSASFRYSLLLAVK